MTPEAIYLLYGRALDYVDDGRCVLLLPGEIDGDYVVAGWVWSPKRVVPSDERHQAAYLAAGAMVVREHFEAEHGLVLA